MTDKLPEFVLSRTFSAPRNTVFKAWTDADQMKQWWGPKGFPVSTATMDLKPGGSYHYALRSAEGFEMWGKFLYREVAAPERLVFISTFSNKAGEVTRHPMVPTWPLHTLSTVTFAEEGTGHTKVTLRGVPENADALELATFVTGLEGMRMAWTATLDQLDAFLAAQTKG